jgi:hypothetical protein
MSFTPYQKLFYQFGIVCGIDYIYIYVMVVNKRSSSQAIRLGRYQSGTIIQPNPTRKVQNNQPPPPFHPLGDKNQDCVAALEA